MYGLIRTQTVCQDYEQTALEDKEFNLSIPFNTEITEGNDREEKFSYQRLVIGFHDQKTYPDDVELKQSCMKLNQFSLSAGLTLCLPVSSAVKFANSLDPDQVLQNVRADMDANSLTL